MPIGVTFWFVNIQVMRFHLKRLRFIWPAWIVAVDTYPKPGQITVPKPDFFLGFWEASLAKTLICPVKFLSNPSCASKSFCSGPVVQASLIRAEAFLRAGRDRISLWHSVDGKKIRQTHQLRWVVYPIIYKVLGDIQTVVVFGISEPSTVVYLLVIKDPCKGENYNPYRTG